MAPETIEVLKEMLRAQFKSLRSLELGKTGVFKHPFLVPQRVSLSPVFKSGLPTYYVTLNMLYDLSMSQVPHL